MHGIGIWDVHPTGGETLKTVRVDPQGNVSLFYLGQLRIGGMNFAQAEDAISAAYRNAGQRGRFVLHNVYAPFRTMRSGGDAIAAG